MVLEGEVMEEDGDGWGTEERKKERVQREARYNKGYTDANQPSAPSAEIENQLLLCVPWWIKRADRKGSFSRGTESDSTQPVPNQHILTPPWSSVTPNRASVRNACCAGVDRWKGVHVCLSG